MSLVKSTSISVDEGEERDLKIYIFKAWDNWDMDCVCVPFRGWMGKTQYLSAFWTGYGSRCQAHQFVFKNGNAAGVFTLNVQPTWHSCGKHWNQHGPASLWNSFDTLYSPSPVELRLFIGLSCPIMIKWDDRLFYQIDYRTFNWLRDLIKPCINWLINNLGHHRRLFIELLSSE